MTSRFILSLLLTLCSKQFYSSYSFLIQHGPFLHIAQMLSTLHMVPITPPTPSLLTLVKSHSSLTFWEELSLKPTLDPRICAPTALQYLPFHDLYHIVLQFVCLYLLLVCNFIQQQGHSLNIYHSAWNIITIR